MTTPVEEAPWNRVSEWIAASLGLHFPPERWEDLKRGMGEAAKEFGFEDVAGLADRLLSVELSNGQLQVLASHLTIGETYFFRDPMILEALATHVLPGLIHSKRGRDQRLRLWSAGCCTGEEPYSLAILLDQRFPELRDWHVTITATDINPRFLNKAGVGHYGEWSFRDAPAGLKERYFNRAADGRLAIRPEIKSRVTFANLNLVEDLYPSLLTDTNAMDLIFCRNVLMYFSPAQIAKVIGKFHSALAQGGWLVVSPSEASKTLFPQYGSVTFPGAILFQKTDATLPGGSIPQATELIPPPILDLPPEAPPESLPGWREPPPGGEVGPAIDSPGSDLALAEDLFQKGRYESVADLLSTGMSARSVGPEGFPFLIRALANQGRLEEALASCDRWTAADKLDPIARYWRAMVLLELGDRAGARSTLQRAIYLRADFVLAHFALGNLARSLGKTLEAEKHFSITQELLRGHGQGDLLPESEGITAGRLTEVVASLTSLENAP